MSDTARELDRIASEAHRQLQRAARRTLIAAQVHALVARPRLSMVAEAIGRESWGNWRAYGYDGQIACLDAAQAALDTLAEHGFPATAEDVPPTPKKPLLVKLLKL